MPVRTKANLAALSLAWALGLFVSTAYAQVAIEVEGGGFLGTLHDNISNRKRQGSGFTPLVVRSHPRANLFRDDAVGFNFEHIFNGAKAQFPISMFTPRQDRCLLKQVGDKQWELRWPSKGSQWGMDASMTYDFSQQGCVDLRFLCTPTKNRYPQGYAAMMWASYMNRAIDRRIHFWGKDGERMGWVALGDSNGHDIEVGTVAHSSTRPLPLEEGSQGLNIREHPRKKFIAPFYYGLLDGDHDLNTKQDKLLYLVLFDQTNSIRFAMWNFFRDEKGMPDTHSPAWDWQFVIRKPEVGKRYGYRARVVVKPFEGEEQIWREYERWRLFTGASLPSRPSLTRME